MEVEYTLNELNEQKVNVKTDTAFVIRGTNNPQLRKNGDYIWFKILPGSILECHIGSHISLTNVDIITQVVMCKLTKFFKNNEILLMTLKWLDDYKTKLEQMRDRAIPSHEMHELTEFATRSFKLYANAMEVEVLKISIHAGSEMSTVANCAIAGLGIIFAPCIFITHTCIGENPLKGYHVLYRSVTPMTYHKIHLNSCYSVTLVDEIPVNGIADILPTAVKCVARYSKFDT